MQDYEFVISLEKQVGESREDLLLTASRSLDECAHKVPGMQGRTNWQGQLASPCNQALATSAGNLQNHRFGCHHGAWQ